MSVCYIGLGANLDDPRQQLEIALQALDQLPHTRVTGRSPVYRSKPLGPQDQPDFYNAVAAVETELSPIELLDALQQQERDQGRIKKRHWGERCIDLDILLFDQLQLRSERLNIPHHEMHKRSFVLVPLAALAPTLKLPDGRVVAELAAEFADELQVCD